MKLTYLFGMLLAGLSGGLLAQNPCNVPGTSVSNSSSTFFSQFKVTSVELNSVISDCFKVNANKDVTILIEALETAQSEFISAKVYLNGQTTTVVNGEKVFGANESFSYVLKRGTQYGVRIQFLGTGTFKVTIANAPQGIAGPYTIQVNATAAPVTWTRDLTYHSAGEQIELNWSVAEQVDVAGYELEKMIPGGSFEKLSEIAYRENGALEVDYSVRTARPSVASYYRIKQLDYAGTFDYSNVLFVPGHDGAVEEFDVYPNPVADYARMSVPAAVTSVELISLAGRIVRSVPAAEVRREGMDVRDLAPGVYLVRPVSGSERSVTRRIVVNH